MATNRGTTPAGTRHEPAEPGDDDTDTVPTPKVPPPGPLDFADVEMADALAEMPQEAKANVFRFSETDATWKWVGSITPASANHEFFSRKWGGGKYKARFRKPGNAGWGRQFTLEIDPSVRPEAEAALSAPVETSRRGADGDEDFKSLYKMELLDLIRSSREAREQSAAGTVGLMKMVMDMVQASSAGTAALIKSMTDVRATAAPAPGLSTAEILKMVGDARRDALELVNTVKGGGAGRMGGGGTIDSTLDIIERLGEIRERLDGSGNGGGEPKKEGGLFDKLLGDVMPLLIEVLKPALMSGVAGTTVAAAPGAHAVHGGHTNGAPVREIAAPVAPPPAHEVPAVSPSAAPAWLGFIKSSLLEAAQEGRPPEDMAVSIMDLAPKAMHGKLREFVMQENPVGVILENAPELKDYPTWLAELIVELRGQFTPPADEGDGEKA